jgi:hypothetical protein
MNKLTNNIICDEVNDEYLCNESLYQIQNDICLKMDDFNNKILNMINKFHLLEYDSEIFSNIKSETYEMYDTTNLFMLIKQQEVINNLKTLELLIDELDLENLNIYNTLRRYKRIIDKITDSINPNDLTDEIKKYFDTVKNNKSSNYFFLDCIILMETELKKKLNLPISNASKNLSHIGSGSINLSQHVKPKTTIGFGTINLSQHVEPKTVIGFGSINLSRVEPQTAIGKIFKNYLNQQYHHICDNIFPLVLHVYEQVYGKNLKYHNKIIIIESIYTPNRLSQEIDINNINLREDFDRHDILFGSYFLSGTNINAKTHRIILFDDKITIAYRYTSYICSIEECARFQIVYNRDMH